MQQNTFLKYKLPNQNITVQIWRYPKKDKNDTLIVKCKLYTSIGLWLIENTWNFQTQILQFSYIQTTHITNLKYTSSRLHTPKTFKPSPPTLVKLLTKHANWYNQQNWNQFKVFKPI